MSKTWNDVREELYSPEEIAESDLRVLLMGEIVRMRKEKGISQRELEKLSGVKQPVIARIESGNSIPNINTVLKILLALGSTLKITPIEQKM